MNLSDVLRWMSTTAIRNRFWSKVNKTNTCWLWTASTKNGYGNITIEGKVRYAHRLSFIWHKGPIPDGLFVLHRCDVHSCINPDHLFLGTQTDNMKDCLDKKRFQFGEQHYATHLTATDVLRIRELCAGGNTQRRVGQMFGLGQRTVFEIVHRKTWKHVE